MALAGGASRDELAACRRGRSRNECRAAGQALCTKSAAAYYEQEITK